MTGEALATKAQRKKSREMRRGAQNEYLDELTVVGILPTMIDTPTNRRFAEEGTDFTRWTQPIDIAKEIGNWIEEPPVRPHSGSLIKVTPNSSGEGAQFQLAR